MTQRAPSSAPRSPTLHDVARAAGVSIKTVSRIVNGSPDVTTTTRARVEQAIADLGYHPNELARSLRARSTKTLGVVIADITNPFYGVLARAVEDVAQTRGHLVVVGNCDEQLDREREFVLTLARRQVDGLILVPALGDHAYLDAVQRQGMAIVLVNRPLPGLALDTVTVDNVNGARQAVAHLLAHGHRRIGLVTGLPGLHTTEARRQGYEMALRDAGLVPCEGWVRLGCKTAEQAMQATADLLAQPDRPTALFGTNNFIALGMLAAIGQRGLRVPDDVALVNFDDVNPFGVFHPRLTVVAQPNYEMGRRAAELLFDRLQAAEPRPPCHLVLPLRLVVRESCGGGVHVAERVAVG